VSEEDDIAYRRRISEVLARNGFQWVVEQADAQIADGKVSSKAVFERERFRPTDDTFEIRKPRRRQASLVTSEPYSENERLEILLNAIRAALIERADLENAILHQLDNITEIQFLPDTPAEEVDFIARGQAHRLDRASTEPVRNLKERTEHVLSALRSR
jgi:hypothetical protein